MWRVLAIAAVLLAGLSACGFQLRTATAMKFDTLYLNANRASPLYNDLRRSLRVNKVQMVTDPKTAQVQLEILGEVRTKQVLSFSSAGQVREFQLLYQLRYQVRDPQGLLLLAPKDISLRRDITYSDNQVLSKESEEQLLYRDMQTDAVEQLIRALSYVNPDAKRPE